MCRNHSVAAVGGATSQANCTCSPGFWSVDATAICQVCPEAYYCEGGMRKVACPLNADTLGATQRTDVRECACKPGYYSTPACEPCPPGSYCSNSLRISCAPYASSPALSATVQACVCVSGYAGSFVGCAACSAGAYTTAANSSQCTSCAAGYFSAVPRATHASVCASCGPGTFTLIAASICTLCPEVKPSLKFKYSIYKLYFFVAGHLFRRAGGVVALGVSVVRGRRMVQRPRCSRALRGLHGGKLQQRCCLRHVHGRHTQQLGGRKSQHHMRSMRGGYLQPLCGRFE